MNNFTVRIELHDADSNDYDNLYEKMKLKGFTKTIKSGDGVFYLLPNAEYNYSSSNESAENVRDIATDIAKSVKKNPSVLVTQSTVRYWYGLDEA